MTFPSAAPPYSIADPYPWYRYIQETKPVYQMPDGTWMITRYDDAAMLLSDKRCSHWGQDDEGFRNMHPLEREIAQTLHALAPGHQPAFRKQIMHQLAGRTRGIDEQLMQDQADTILHRLKSATQIDLMKDYAHPFTFGTTCRIMGVPEDETDALSTIVSSLPGGYLSFASQAQQLQNRNAAGQVFIEALQRLITLKQRSPGNDLCSALLAVCPPDEENEAFLISLIVLLFYAGHQNMMNFIGNALVALHNREEDQSRMRESLTFSVNSVDELIRYDAPLQAILLISREAIYLQHQTIPAGSKLLVQVGAANRDPATFANPAALLLTRKPAHLGFGTGAFRCVGARLAQSQGGIGLHRFFVQARQYQLIPEKVQWTSFAVQRGPSAVPAVVNWNL